MDQNDQPSPWREKNGEKEGSKHGGSRKKCKGVNQAMEGGPT